MYTITKRQLMILTLGGFLSYLLFGIFDSMRGTTLSPLLSDLHFNYASGGTIVMGQYAGYFAATLLAGILADRTGPKFTLVLAAASLLFGVVGYSASSGMFPLIAFIFFIGIGLGSLELGGCNIITALYQEKKGRYLNILAAIAGCGAFITPVIAGLLLDQGTSWRVIYRIGLIIAVPVAFYFVLLKNPPVSRSAGGMSEKKELSQESSKGSARLGVWIMNFSNFAYMAAEIGTASWLVDFYQNVKHFSVLESSTGLSLFYIGITAGRFAGSLFVDRLGHFRSVLMRFFRSGMLHPCRCIWPGRLCYPRLYHRVLLFRHLPDLNCHYLGKITWPYWPDTGCLPGFRRPGWYVRPLDRRHRKRSHRSGVRHGTELCFLPGHLPFRIYCREI